MSHDNTLRFRIGIINDFQGTLTVVDYRRFGEVTFVDAFEIKKGRDPLDSSSGIYVFFNYEKVGMFKVKEEARNFILEMLEKAPAEIKKEKVLFNEYLLRFYGRH